MNTMNRIISLLMVTLMFITAVPFVPAGAAESAEENYTLTVENSFIDSSLSENSTVGGISFFGGAEFDGCYGNQLSGVARELYDSMVKNFATDKKTGEYTYTFDTPFTFEAEISGGYIVENDELEEIELEIGYAVQIAMDAFLYDHPEVFWLRIIKSSYNISASGNSFYGYVGSISNITIIPTEIYSGASAKISQYDTAVDSALASIAVTESRYETLKSIHDYICNKAWYNLVNEKRVHSSEPFFVGDGGVVCEGYAKAFKVLCDRKAIPCVLVSGYAGENHMWNYVQMDDGRWYLVDATWDDQESRIYDTYFLANTNTIGFEDIAISAERTERNDFSGTGIFSFTYPVLSDAAYGIHVHEWESDYIVDSEPTCTEKGSKSIHCKTCDETKDVTEISATNHANKTAHTEQVATCTDYGYTAGVYCTDCEKWLEGHEKTEKLSHTFTTYISDGNATCMADGTKTAVCDMCKKANDKVTDEGSKNSAEHKYSVRAGSSATCTEDGEKIYVCDVCEKATYSETIPATGKHSFTARLGEDPTCTEDGFVEYCCEICETETYRETVPATGHDYNSVVTAPTCTEEGYTTHSCKLCGDEYTDASVRAGHKGGTATCNSKAVCTACGEEYGSFNPNIHKSFETLKAVDSTCSKTGLTEGKKCKDCGKITLAQKTVAKKAHYYKAKVTKATLSKNGKLENKCTVCGYAPKPTVIYAPKAIKLSATAYSYNGKIKTPSVIVKDSKGKTLKKNTDYTVKYSKGRKSIGKYTVTVTFKGNYSGIKKLTFEIVPAKVSLSKLTAGKKQLTAFWKPVSGATGYEVQYSTSKSFTKKTTKTVTIKKAKTKKTTIKKLRKGKKYFVKVRAYKTVSGKRVFGAWSAVKSVKVR